MPKQKLPALTYDPEANAVSLRLRRGTAVPPVTREIAPGVSVDLVGGEVVGVEILDARERFDADLLEGIVAPITWLTLREAAKLSKRSAVTLRMQLSKGRLPGRKEGRDWFVTERDLVNYLETLGPAGRPTKNPRAPRRRRGASATR